MQVLLNHRSRAASPRRSVAAWGFWLARWMLVLLLMADQVGAPLHHHRHDSGVDNSWLTATVALEHGQDQGSESDSHVEDSDHGQHFGHATLVVRNASETLQIAQLAEDDARGTDHALALIQFVTALTLLAPIEAAHGLPPPYWRSPDLGVFRSLPPAGRAPPLHA